MLETIFSGNPLSIIFSTESEDFAIVDDSLNTYDRIACDYDGYPSAMEVLETYYKSLLVVFNRNDPYSKRVIDAEMRSLFNSEMIRDLIEHEKEYAEALV